MVDGQFQVMRQLLKNDLLGWEDISLHIEKVEGVKISKKRCQQIGDVALRKVRLAIKKDPFIVEHLKLLGLDVNKTTRSGIGWRR